MASSARIKEFTLFSKLPNEIKLKIFDLAPPKGYNGERLLCVEVDCVLYPHLGTREAVANFMPQIYLYENKLGENIEAYDVGLSRACFDSRSIYQSAFSSVLRGNPKHHPDTRIYYDPANTLLYACAL